MSKRIPKINPGLSIPELFKLSKHSVRDCKLDEVQDILMQRERNTLIEREKLERKCEELKNSVVKMGLEIEDLKRQKLAVPEELKRQIDVLGLKLVESDKIAEGYKNRFESLKPRVTNLEMAIANMLNVRVEDLALVVNRIENHASSDSLPMSSEKGPHEHDATSQKMASSAAGDVIVICDSDDERDVIDTTYASDTSSSQMYRRNGRRSNEEGIKKRKGSISLDEDVLRKQHIPNTGLPQSSISPTLTKEINFLNGVSTDSDDDESSCSDAYMDNLVATIQSKTLPPP